MPSGKDREKDAFMNRIKIPLGPPFSKGDNFNSDLLVRN